MVGDIADLGVGEARLSLLTNPEGGIIDDTIITNAGDYTCVRACVRAIGLPHPLVPTDRPTDSNLSSRLVSCAGT